MTSRTNTSWDGRDGRDGTLQLISLRTHIGKVLGTDVPGVPGVPKLEGGGHRENNTFASPETFQIGTAPAGCAEKFSEVAVAWAVTANCALTRAALTAQPKWPAVLMSAPLPAGNSAGNETNIHVRSAAIRLRFNGLEIRQAQRGVC